MGMCVFQDGTKIQDYTTPYFVAEVNSSHNGDVAVARKMIDAAAAIGCQCVKFQSWSTASLYCQSYYEKNPIAKRFVDKFSLAPSQLKEMAAYCCAKGVAFASTPYSNEEVDFLIEECHVPFIKIASMELNNLSFLRYIASKDTPIVLSTGMGEFAEIEAAVRCLEEAGTRHLVLLHCISLYPTDAANLNLNNILGLRERYPQYPIGFSDHTEGDAAAVAATALGAALIEKHLTLDHSKVGMDNGMATEPPAFKNLVDKCRIVHRGLGHKERTVLPEEYEQRKKMRRSLVAAHDIPAGTVLAEPDIIAKRPGEGIPLERLPELLGRTTVRAVKEDTLFCWSDVEEC